jgi:hypothetical protein
MKVTADELEAVAVAVLAVNNYRIEKAWDLLPKLREAGLTTPASVAPADIGALTVRLVAAGYDRGMLTSMLARRLQNLMQAAEAGVLDGLTAAAARKDKAAAVEILTRVKGIGPQVAESTWLLVQLAEREPNKTNAEKGAGKVRTAAPAQCRPLPLTLLDAADQCEIFPPARRP